MPESLFDFPGAPLLREGPNLRDMSRIDIAQLVNAMATSDVVIVVYPEDDFTILRGEPKLQHLRDTGERAALSFTVLQVANDTQAEMVAGALEVGRMTRQQAERFRDLLISAQDVRNTRH